MITKKSTCLCVFILLTLLNCDANFISAEAQSNLGVNRDSDEAASPSNWQQLSFAELNGVLESGTIGSEFDNLVGYDFERVWNAGDTPDRFLKLGDLENFLAPQSFNLEEIAQSTSSSAAIDFESLSLSEFPLIGEQTLSDLVEAIPNLKQFRVDEIEPIRQLLSQSSSVDDSRKLGQLLLSNPRLGNLKLDSIDLSQYSISSIPNLEQTDISKFEDWESQFVSEVPGLSEVSLNSYPNALSENDSIIARADFIWGTAEADRQRTISGSYLEGFSVPCESQCAHIELDDFENVGDRIQLPFEGKQWISGKYQWVMGGAGCLVGQEPTGIHPFGNTFKVVLWETYETTDTAEVMIFFNFKTLCGESPYIIGPIPSPLGSIKINDWLFIGT